MSVYILIRIVAVLRSGFGPLSSGRPLVSARGHLLFHIVLAFCVHPYRFPAHIHAIKSMSGFSHFLYFRAPLRLPHILEYFFNILPQFHAVLKRHSYILGQLYASPAHSAFLYGFPNACLLYTSPSPRDTNPSRMPSSA